MEGNSTYNSDNLVLNDLRAVQQIRFLADNTFILRFERGDMQFKAGQYIKVGMENFPQHREYSIYSGENDPFLEILVREVIEGNLSLLLKDCKPGDQLLVKGPFGELEMKEEERYSKKHIFIGSGTGIAPFHSFIQSYPGIDYSLIHGVRYIKEAYERDHYNPEKYVLCTTREKNGNFFGRVTAYLEQIDIAADARCYVCGNSSMIYDVYSVLRKKGIPVEKIYSEVYF